MPDPVGGKFSSSASRPTHRPEGMRDCASVALLAVDGAASAKPKPDLRQIAQQLLDHLHARKRFLSPSLFHEPAWEILLSTFVAHHRGMSLNVKQLVSLIDAPPTTSQRWIDQLVHMKLLQREVDAADRRRLEITMSPAGAKSVSDYLEWLTTNSTSTPAE